MTNAFLPLFPGISNRSRFERGELVAVGEPVEGTKKRQIRRVPIIPAMEKLIARIAKKHQGEAVTENALKVKSSAKALKRSCGLLALEPLTQIMI